jgi:hypothetical protein
MSAADRTDGQYWKPLRYSLVYLLIVVGLVAVGFALRLALDVSLSPGLSTLLPPMLASLVEGQNFAMKEGSRPPKSKMWRAALGMTACVVVLNLVFTGVIVLVQPDVLSALARFGELLALLAVFFLGLVLLINRFFYGLGVRSYLKSMAAKGRG